VTKLGKRCAIFQRNERIEFFRHGKNEFKELRSAVYRTVKNQFTERWSEYYNNARNPGATEFSELAAIKSGLLAEQKQMLESRRDLACQALRASRDIEYRLLLDHQKAQRVELRLLQKLGLDTAPFLNGLGAEAPSVLDVRTAFRTSAAESTDRRQVPEVTLSEPVTSHENTVARSPGETARPERKVTRFGISLLDALFTDLTNLGSAPPEPRRAEEKEADFREAAESAVKQQQKHARDEEDDRWKVRQKAIFRE
jgi:hypothetical protein